MTNVIRYDTLLKGGSMKAVDYFLNGNSCSEAIILEASDNGLCSKDLISVATSFSGGIGSGCLCGAVAGAVMVIGELYGKENKYGNIKKTKRQNKRFRFTS